MKKIKDFEINDIINVVGKVTISFRVKPVTKLNLQIAAEKLNVSFANLCENILENKLHKILKEPEQENKKTNKNKTKKDVPAPATEKKIIIDAKYNLRDFLEKHFQQKYVKGLVNPNWKFLHQNETKELDNRFKLNDSNESFYVRRINYSQYEVTLKQNA